MNRRNKLKRRRRQRVLRKKENMPLVRICRRCQQPFSPNWLDGLEQWSWCCEVCALRNIAEACGLQELLPNFCRTSPAKEAKADTDCTDLHGHKA